MSKNTGIGRKRIGSKMEKGIDRCDVSSHGKQCGRPTKVTKGNKQWTSQEKEINPFHEHIPKYHLPDD